MNTLTLKWGSIKGWHLETAEARALMQKWIDGGVSYSAMAHEDSPEQKQIILELIDHVDEIWLDWDGKQVSRAEAKQYIENYGKDHD